MHTSTNKMNAIQQQSHSDSLRINEDSPQPAPWIRLLETPQMKLSNSILSVIEEDKIRKNGRNHHHNKCQHIMFLYNSKSGSGKALSLLSHLKVYTSLLYDLFQLNSSKIKLQKLSNDIQQYEDKLIVFIVGGDSSQNWAASLIDKAIQFNSPKQISFPVIIPFPIGTGNDLSRSLGWGHIPDQIIKHVADAQFCYNHSKRFDVLDRWSIKYTFDTNECINSFNPPLPQTFCCAVSIGYDAMIVHAHKFNIKRNIKPKSNESLDFELELNEIVRHSNDSPINDYVELTIDETATKLPAHVHSLRVENLDSWGHSSKDKSKKPMLNDGLVEVMATRGLKHLAFIENGLSHAHRLGQSNNIKIKITKTPFYLQIDGTAFKIDSNQCTLDIQLHDQLPTLIGYNFPRGTSYQHKFYTEKFCDKQHRFLDVMKRIYLW